MNIISTSARSAQIAKKRAQLRGQLWPKVKEGDLWHRKRSKGFTTIPRTMSLIMGIIDSLSPKGKPASYTYFELWCRAYDEMIVTLDHPQEMAFASGFEGQRGTQTWLQRIDILEKLEFIALAEGALGPRSFCLILNPFAVIKRKRGKISARRYNALLARASMIGAADLD